ncbi:MAG: DUF1614 domain-containing protein [Gammaproteobacteria bacterium]|nr:DUF1614 domain-containing protein [Gammaproteobacteria bacterium]MBU1978646.1 DUF1614 domain-containing protein [Gammaproteobacteria bacterium]
MPFSPFYFALLLVALGLLAVFVQIGALTLAFDKLGLSPHSATLLLFTSLLGSLINLPLFSVKAEGPSPPLPQPFRSLLRLPPMEFTGKTVVAINVGGCLVPLAFSVFLLRHNPLNLLMVISAVALVAMVCRLASRPVPGVGIGIPIFVAPLVAAMTSLIIDPENSAPLAYISGTLGVLIGADLSRLGDIRKMGAPFASIGGAGTFDGIFLSGIVAVLLT